MSKALFWDFDGTLVHNSGGQWASSSHASLAKLGYDIDIEKVRHHFSRSVKGFSWHTPENSYTDAVGQQWWDKLFEHLDVLYNEYKIPEQDRHKANSYFRNYILDYKNYTLYDDAALVLRECLEMGYKNYIVSNNYPELALVVEGLGLAKYVDAVIVSANIGYEKPRVEIFNYALEVAEYPDTCYMIGDNPVADVQGGKAAGLTTILVHTDADTDADYHCKNLSEIPQLLK